MVRRLKRRRRALDAFTEGCSPEAAALRSGQSVDACRELCEQTDDLEAYLDRMPLFGVGSTSQPAVTSGGNAVEQGESHGGREQQGRRRLFGASNPEQGRDSDNNSPTNARPVDTQRLLRLLPRPKQGTASTAERARPLPRAAHRVVYSPTPTPPPPPPPLPAAAHSPAAAAAPIPCTCTCTCARAPPPAPTPRRPLAALERSRAVWAGYPRAFEALKRLREPFELDGDLGGGEERVERRARPEGAGAAPARGRDEEEEEARGASADAQGPAAAPSAGQAEAADSSDVDEDVQAFAVRRKERRERERLERKRRRLVLLPDEDDE